MFSRILVAVLAASLGGCNVVQVSGAQKDENGKVSRAKLPGLPFYVKHQQFRQVSVYRETWYRLTLKAETRPSPSKGGQEKPSSNSESFTAEVKKLDSEVVINLKDNILNAGCMTSKESRALIKEFEKLPDRVDAADPSMVRLLRNDVESEWVVDDANPFYLNAKLPWFGSGSLTQKLAADGTLTEVTSTPDTKLAEGLSTLIPFKEFLAGKYVKAATSTDADPWAKYTKGDGTVNCLSLVIEETGYETTVKSAPQKERPTVAKALEVAHGTNDAPSVWLSRKPIEDDAKPKDDAPTIGISGSIKLPKEKS